MCNLAKGRVGSHPPTLFLFFLMSRLREREVHKVPETGDTTMKRFPLLERKGIEDLSKGSPSGAFSDVSLPLALPGG